MLVVLAHARDDQARALVDRWAPLDARLMTVQDLSAPGWQHHVGGTGSERAVLGGIQVETAAIRGVVTRLPCVQETDLAHIAPGDRPYVAAEMTAFLKSWLSRLSCPVLNRPTASSLMGPNRSLERWMVLAARCGLAVFARRSATGEALLPARECPVTVLGQRWFGEVDEALGEQAMRLALQAKVDLLTVRFDGSGAGAAFLSAELSIDVSAPAVRDALLERLERGEQA